VGRFTSGAPGKPANTACSAAERYCVVIQRVIEPGGWIFCVSL
jgi:hypothetical protein